jgi:hypothetical protein
MVDHWWILTLSLLAACQQCWCVCVVCVCVCCVCVPCVYRTCRLLRGGHAQYAHGRHAAAHFRFRFVAS